MCLRTVEASEGMCLVKSLVSFLLLHPFVFSVSSLGVTQATGGTICTTAHHSTAGTATPPQCRTLTCMPLHMVHILSTATSSW
uniref:Secreted protein n=1 Tax=Arundo donax TaxID=35708 RepID=A0A0A9CZ50_ARUDO